MLITKQDVETGDMREKNFKCDDWIYRTNFIQSQLYLKCHNESTPNFDDECVFI